MHLPLQGKRILILIGGHLATAPRPQKEAAAARAAGAEVMVRGTWWNHGFAAEDRELASKIGVDYSPVVDIRPHVPGGFSMRLKQRFAREAFGRVRWTMPRAFGVGAPEFHREALRIRPDLVIVHSEATMWAGERLARQGFRVGVDFEDWFSEDLLPEVRKHRPIKALHRLEEALLMHSVHKSCTSRAMADALVSEFNCRPPVPIYNAFPWSDRRKLDGKLKDGKNRELPSIHWYSQTLGPGRGLEELFDALPNVRHSVEVHLRGNPVNGFHEWLASRLSEMWRSRVFVHDLVSNDELLSRISEHDIGFAGEMKYCRSRDLTVTNKILHYLLGGLAVVASDTAGQKEIARQASSAVFLYPTGAPVKLADQLNLLLGEPDRLKEAKAAALRAAESLFCWERVSPPLLESLTRALGRA